MRASRRQFIAAGALAAPAFSDTRTNETLKTIHSLRTIHGDFSAKQVSEADLTAILEASVRAANASLMQSYSIIVVRDGPTMQKLTGYRGSCMLLYCADYNRLIGTAQHLGHEYHPGDMESFVTASTNTILAAQTAAIAAKSLGIDSQFTNGIHRGDMERIWAILGLPEKHCFPLIALILGYAAKEPPHQKGRLSRPGVIHEARYHKLTKEELDGIVRQYDDPSLHLTLNDEWKKRHKRYLDWYYKEWLGRFAGGAGETQMLRRLKKSGFVEGA